ncbi:vWA domain-containing protein [Thermohalobacter berrensis]|uniref:VWFA domain-containing protein n=1 Tax=Thermohalobacter berrensis TaxID=99594 RepID=A0A419SZ62_9FIRM|nr:BatA domain-containing protein [Thermohalobacter berrensis]RKD30552.1 hypothetical protein BET03_04230 [Thermohalobacter berrensis]
MNFYSPISFLFLLGIIPIILMYLLKKKHERIEISSTYLWKKAIKDMEANTPWQKLKKNLLLLLQILIFTLIVLALTEPYIISESMNVENLIIVLDKSTSMQSTDIKESRFNMAKEEIEKIVDNLRKESYVTLITMGNKPEILLNKGNDKGLIRKKLRNIQVGNSSDNIEDTLSLIRAMTKGMKNYRVIFYTDKGIEEELKNITVKNIKKDKSQNIAIEKLTHAVDNGKMSVLITVTNYSNLEKTGDLTLYVDNEIYDVKEVTIKGKNSRNIYFDVPSNSGLLEAEIDINDDLKIDNKRYHVIKNTLYKKVLLTTKGNLFLEKAISLNNNVELYKSNKILEDIRGYDLYVYDGMIPDKLPLDGNIVIFDPPKNNGIINVKGKVMEGELKIKEDELFNYVDMDFASRGMKVFETPKWGVPILLLNDYPVMVKGMKDKQKFIIAGFDLHETDFPLKTDFPIFISNILDYTLNIKGQENIKIFSGEEINIEILPKTEIAYVITPSGLKKKIAPPFPVAPYTDTNETGIYKIIQESASGDIISYFATNINTKQESNINFEYTLKGTTTELGDNKGEVYSSLQSLFIWLALIFLALEWVVYNRGY